MPTPSSAVAQSHPARIAVISFFILMLELALIRFIPSEIKVISYFTNLLLFSAFFGMGLGCILWKRPLPAYVMPVGLFLICLFVYLSRGITVYENGGDVHYWFQQSDQKFKPFLQMPLVVMAILCFVISAIPFVTMGWTLAREMQVHRRLVGYGYDLLGSLLGTVVFAFVSYLGCPPWVMIILTAVVWALVFHQEASSRMLYILPGCMFVMFVVAPYSWSWSPYYFVQYNVDSSRITIWVNSSFHQEAVNFQTKAPGFQNVAKNVEQKFNLPYEIYRQHHGGTGPKKILILGAGSGNDVNIARLNGAQDITAVEIDPQIARIGREFNPMQPYQDSYHVHLVIDDGRHFLRSTREQYDLVVFGTLDSQTLLSGQANLRLDNYIYTTECFQDAREVLVSGGMLATYYSVSKQWFLGRIYSTVASAFPGHLQIFVFQDNYLFNTIIIGGKDLSNFVANPQSETQLNTVRPSSDDWPYIYIEKPTIAPLYLEVFALIGVLITLVLILLRRIEKSDSWHLDFFFLGVGFSLIESAAIVRLALAFGTTWVVSAVVFAAVLLTVFLANWLSEWKPVIRGAYVWPALLVCLAINFFFPVRMLLELSFSLRLLVSLGLIGIPVFFAGLTFSRLFRHEAEVGAPFGMNMIGAMAGGSIEYLSMLLGMRKIWLILLVVYALAWLCNGLKHRSQPATSG